MRTSFTVILVCVTAVPASAASAVNRGTRPETIVVVAGSGRSDITLAPNQQVDFCPDGCIVTFANGQEEALTGAEFIEITDGKAHID
jgi:hypothetical protein